MTSKERAELRASANAIDTVLVVGKQGCTEQLIQQLEMTITARELVKGKVLENSLLPTKEVAEALSTAVRAEVVQVIGSKFVLYRKNKEKEREDRKKQMAKRTQENKKAKQRKGTELK